MPPILSTPVLCAIAPQGTGPLMIGNGDISLTDVWEVSVGGRPVVVADEGRRAVRSGHEFLLREIASGRVMYGINTGFGSLADVSIPVGQLAELQRNILRSHAAGIGGSEGFLDDSYVRAMLLLRANALVQGHSGVSTDVVDQLVAFLNARIHPLVTEKGSVGASGDLVPLAQLALPLIGEGRVRYRGTIVPTGEALTAAGLRPLTLGPKEGLGLVNGTQFMTAIGTLTYLLAEHVFDLSLLASAMSIEAMLGTIGPFKKPIHRVWPHPGQVAVAQRMRGLLAPEGVISEMASSKADRPVQTAYSTRTIPQVMGVVRMALDRVRDVLGTEVNAVTDNPLIFADAGEVLSGGNFHGQFVSHEMDQMAIAMADLVNIAGVRVQSLMNPKFSGLPAYLIANPGLMSGLMMVDVGAASLMAEARTLATPASVGSLVTAMYQEDHVSMGAQAARKAANAVVLGAQIVALELLAASQAVHLRRPLKTTPVLERLYERIRAEVMPVDADRELTPDITALETRVVSGALAEFVTPA